jgi:hypothetical protein
MSVWFIVSSSHITVGRTPKPTHEKLQILNELDKKYAKHN